MSSNASFSFSFSADDSSIDLSSIPAFSEIEPIYHGLIHSLDVLGKSQKTTLGCTTSFCKNSFLSPSAGGDTLLSQRATVPSKLSVHDSITIISNNVSQLLLSDHDHLPTTTRFVWDDLVNARLMVDTEFYDIISFSPDSSYIHIKEQRHKDDPHQSQVHKSTRTRHNLSSFLLRMVFATAKAVRGSDLLSDRLSSSTSIHILFGLPPTMSSISKARIHLSHLGYVTRHKILSCLVSLVQAHDRHRNDLSKLALIPSSMCQDAFQLATRNVSPLPTPCIPALPTPNTEDHRWNSKKQKLAPDDRTPTTDSPSPAAHNTDEPPLPVIEFSPPTRVCATKDFLVCLQNKPTPRQWYETDKLLIDTLLMHSTLVSSTPFPNSFDQYLTCSRKNNEFVDLLRCPTTTSFRPDTVSTKAALPPCFILPMPLKCHHAPEQTPFVIAISPFLSAINKRAFMEKLEISFFMKGYQGRKSSYIRCPCTSSPTLNHQQYFQIANTFYPTCTVSDEEANILQLFNQFIHLQHQAYIAARSPDSHSSPVHTTTYNALQIVVSCLSHRSGYKEHDDFGRLVGTLNDTKPSGHEMVSQDPPLRLPNKYEFQTPTLVLTTERDQAKETHVVVWTHDGKLSGKVSTNGNFFHFQAHGCQDGYMHAVTSVPSSTSGDHIRVVISGRYIVPVDQETIRSRSLHRITTQTKFLTHDDYQFTNVISQLQNGKQPILSKPPSSPVFQTIINDPFLHPLDTTLAKDSSPVAVSLLVDQQPPATWNCASLNDCLTSLSYEEYKKFNIYRNEEIYIERKEDMRVFIMDAMIVKKLLLQFGIIPTISWAEHPKPTSAIFALHTSSDNRRPQLFDLLTCLNSEYVTSEAGIPHTNRAHPPTCGEESKCNVFVITKTYKNDMRSIVRYIQKAIEIRSIGHHTGHTPPGNVTPPPTLEDCIITIFGSGGSSQMSDQYGCKLSKTNKYDATARMACAQDCESAQTQTMIKLSERDGVVALFISFSEIICYLDEDQVSTIRSLNNMFHDDDAEDVLHLGEVSLFLGYFCVFKSGVEEGLSPVEINKLLRNVPKATATIDDDEPETLPAEHQRHATFLLEKHWAFRLRPLFTSIDDLRILQENNKETTGPDVQRKMWEKFSIGHSDLSQRPRIRLPPNVPLTDVVEFSTSSTYTKEQFTDEFIQQCVVPAIEIQNKVDLDHDDDIPRTYSFKYQPFPKGTTLHSTEEAILIACYVNAAACMRYNAESRCVSDPSRSTPLTDPRLPTINQAHPTPMASRPCDVTTLALRASAMLMEILKADEQGNTQRNSVATVVDEDLFFHAILNRLTGRPKVYQAFRSIVGNNEEHNRNHCFFPTKDELPLFFDFLERVDDAFSRLFNPQHDESIPKKLRTDRATFQHCIEQLAMKCSRILLDMYCDASSRSDMVSLLARELRSIYSNVGIRDRHNVCECGRVEFLAGQVLADLEEIYEDPFGPVTMQSVCAGFGGMEGMSILPIEAASTKSKKNAGKLQSFLCDMIRILKKSPHQRKILCLEEDDRGTLCHRLNGRPLNIVDAEHICCKLWVSISKTFSTRARTKQPQSSKPGHHPVHFSPYCVPWDDEKVRQICESSVIAFRYAWDHNLIRRAPDICRIPGEEMARYDVSQRCGARLF